MGIKQSKEELTAKLEKIKAIFDIAKLASLKSNLAYIAKYYRVNKIAYTLFHGRDDLIYLGISRDGLFKRDDLLEAARATEKYILKTQAEKVLELATGRGANSFYLAKRHPDVEFYGVDISPGQLGLAFKKARRVANYHPAAGDYHDLKRFSDNSFDVVFVVEALCYSERKDIALKEVYRVLKPGGFFIIFDGYRGKKTDELEENERVAMMLMERGFALNVFETHQSFKAKIAVSGLDIESEENVSAHVIPTTKIFERLASRFFNHPFLARGLTKVLPDVFTFNAISGYLMPTLIRMGAFQYWITILRKP